MQTKTPNATRIPLAWRMMREVPLRLLWRFAVGAGLDNVRAIRAFERRKRLGRVFPPFVFISVTQRCNLACRGCWARGVQTPADMAPETLHAVVTESSEQGCRFFGILGGEPLLLPWLPDFFAAHPAFYFQLFTNGGFLNDSVAARLRSSGNVSPLISVEGVGASYAARRGSGDAYGRALEALACCRRHGLVTGVATSVSASTFKDVVSDAFVDDMVARGAHYIWFYIYRPSGPEPCFEEALDDAHVRELRRFLLEQRKRCRAAVIVDAYWNHEGQAVCPAAMGVSHHVSATGAIEPCPPIQCADVSVGATKGITRAVSESTLLAAFRSEVPGWTRGCALMDHPAELGALAKRCGAFDSSGRGTFFDELSARPVLGCHNHSGDPMPETSWAYRFAKKHWFFGFGAYG